MAAILCKPISACIALICTAPCKICSQICSGGCKICSEGISGFCTNPLSAFVMITFVTQIPLAVVAAFEVGGLVTGCKGSTWLVGMLAVAIANMAASVYLAKRVTDRTDETLRYKHTSWERISYLLCHDLWIAMYLLVVCFFVGWLVVGSSWMISGSMDDGTEDCGSDVDDSAFKVLLLGWFYLFAGPTVLSCNLCCVCCDKTDYAGDDAAFEAKKAEKEAKKQQKHSVASNYNNNNNNNNSVDIENPIPPPLDPESMRESKSRNPPSPPKTYTVDGVAIADDGKNADAVEAEVVIEGHELPPPMSPPQAAKANADVTTSNAQAPAGKAAQSVSEKVGGWFNRKKKKGGNGDLPERKATLY